MLMSARLKLCEGLLWHFRKSQSSEGNKALFLYSQKHIVFQAIVLQTQISQGTNITSEGAASGSDILFKTRVKASGNTFTNDIR